MAPAAPVMAEEWVSVSCCSGPEALCWWDSSGWHPLTSPLALSPAVVPVDNTLTRIILGAVGGLVGLLILILVIKKIVLLILKKSQEKK